MTQFQLNPHHVNHTTWHELGEATESMPFRVTMEITREEICVNISGIVECERVDLARGQGEVELVFCSSECGIWRMLTVGVRPSLRVRSKFCCPFFR